MANNNKKAKENEISEKIDEKIVEKDEEGVSKEENEKEQTSSSCDVACPSCNYLFPDTPNINEISQTDWLSGPQLICPVCNGHSDRLACIQHVFLSGVNPNP